MAISAIRGSGLPLPTLTSAGNLALNTNTYQYPAGLTSILPAGNYMVGLGNYTALEVLDPITNRFVTKASLPGALQTVNSDGVNYRIRNTTGCPVGAVVTTAGSGYTNGIWINGVTAGGVTGGPTVTVSAGSSTWTIIVGGAVSSTTTSVSGGSGYLFAPQVIVSAPPQGGLPATAHATISGGAVNAVVIDNQGAGYTTAPTITFVNDPRDTVGSGASFTTALTGSGTVTGMYPNSHGTPVTSVPTFTFSSGSAAATMIMNFTVTGYTVTTAGSTYTGTPQISSIGNLVAATSVLTNPFYTTGVTAPRPCRIQAALSGGGITATGAIIEDAGFGIQAVPTPIIATNGTQPTIANAATVVLTVGGTTDTVFIQSI